MTKCEACLKEFEVLDHDILAVSSELLEAHLLCPHCGKGIVVKMRNGD